MNCNKDTDPERSAETVGLNHIFLPQIITLHTGAAQTYKHMLDPERNPRSHQ